MGHLPLAILLAVVLAVHLASVSATTTTYSVTGDFTRAGESIDGDVYDLTSITAATPFITSYITECSISGDGFGLTAFSSSADVNSSFSGMNLTMSGNTVTNASIRMQGYYPYHSTIMISGTRAAMLGTTPLYHFQNLVPQNYVIFYLQDTTVTWDESSGDGGAVLYLGGTEQQVMSTYSGFYMVNTEATNAAHMMYQGLPLCSSRYCINMASSLLSIDNATCRNCRGSFLEGATSASMNPFLSGSDSSIIRFSNLTMTGDYPFVNSNGRIIFSIQSPGTFSMYGIQTESLLLRFAGAYLNSMTGIYSFAHINASAFSIDGVRPNVISGGIRYGGNLTFNKQYMTSVADCKAYNLTINYFVDPYSILVERDDATANLSTEVVGKPSAMFCAENWYSGVTLETMAGGWQRANCVCPENTYPPYCSPVFDPIQHYVYYTDKEVVSCTVANCSQCITGRPNECSRCDATFKLSETTCVPKVCEAANCSECVYDSERDCAVCEGNFKRGSDNVSCVAMDCNADHCDVCVTEKDTVCQKCSTNYKLDGTNETCTAMICEAAHCSKCVDDTETTCETCSVGYAVSSSDGTCATTSTHSGLSTNAIIGICVAIGVVALLAALFLILFFCWRKRKNEKETIHALETVNPLKRRPPSAQVDSTGSTKPLGSGQDSLEASSNCKMSAGGFGMGSGSASRPPSQDITRLSSRGTSRTTRPRNTQSRQMLISDVELETIFQQEEIENVSF